MIYTPRNFGKLVRHVLKNGDYVDPGGNPTIEMLSFQFETKDPRDRIVTDPIRKMNLAFGYAEWLGMMFNINDVDFYTTYIQGYGRYSTDGVEVDGAYGRRIHEHGNQIAAVIEMLKKDPSQRRAIVQIYDPRDLTQKRGMKNTPCTLHWQFLVRNNRLEMIVSMRSNDVVWGLTFDQFAFSMVQEYVANELGLELGSYRHHAGSFHIYERHFDYERNLESRASRLPPMRPMEYDRHDLKNLVAVYTNPTEFTAHGVAELFTTEWTRDAAYVATSFANRGVRELQQKHLERIEDPIVRHIANFW